ncbi:catalase [Virgibacillus sp. NKC19-16]|uniref:catalase n=1 Tax=Virgibacillus salidurans TaxID=2831673 RepID=UPI001F3FEB2F|nr:catalase [Virgibacillus sp. NKC19-16]UJL47164.1 catalase [Virgibacillus sp. NKC19-16]
MTNEDKNKKQKQLDQDRVKDQDQALTTNQGLKMAEDEFSLKAGERGSTLLEDFHFREKMTHFDHERIPERVVHARGYGAHGEFELYESLAPFTKANFLTETGKKTPVFVRFSTVQGSRGSFELARDVRGFATKFYTDEGNFDLVGNNMPVFFMQDGIKFPDFVHAVKPEPHHEMPQAATAHDTFWDWIANNQESAHMVMWAMSDRAIPRSYRMMEGFGVHTFRLVNEQGQAFFVKFHWKPVLGVHSVIWDEAQKINGDDPDFHRRDLYESIEQGNHPEFELGVQIINEEDEFSFDFDILDPTKIWPEEDVPVKIIGKMTLNRNVDNVFAETEQVAFHPGSVVPGIDFSNDPLLQARLFSYTDTQLIRLGGPNFHELPINRPVCPFHNNQRDGYGRKTINVGQVSYHKNSLANNTPKPVSEEEGGFSHYQGKVEGRKVRARSESFTDHFSQAILFWNSMSDVEKQHIINAFSFELGKCKEMTIREQVLEMYSNVSHELVSSVAQNLGMQAPKKKEITYTKSSPALSQANTTYKTDTRTVGVIAADGFPEELHRVINELKQANIIPQIVSDHQGRIQGKDGSELTVDDTFQTSDSVLFDSILITNKEGKTSLFSKEAPYFVKEAFLHYKPTGAIKEGTNIIQDLQISGESGVVKDDSKQFIEAIRKARFWDRSGKK